MWLRSLATFCGSPIDTAGRVERERLVFLSSSVLLVRVLMNANGVAFQSLHFISNAKRSLFENSSFYSEQVRFGCMENLDNQNNSIVVIRLTHIFTICESNTRCSVATNTFCPVKRPLPQRQICK